MYIRLPCASCIPVTIILSGVGLLSLTVYAVTSSGLTKSET